MELSTKIIRVDNFVLSPVHLPHQRPDHVQSIMAVDLSPVLSYFILALSLLFGTTTGWMNENDCEIHTFFRVQKKLSDVGFKVVPGLLVDCGLPDVRLWYNTVKRGAHTLPTVKAILHEIEEVRNMRKQNPGKCAVLVFVLKPVAVSLTHRCGR